MTTALLLALVAPSLLAPAHAGTVLDWQEDFDSFNQFPFSGTAGWESGYTFDGWTTLGIGGVAPVTNNSTGSAWDTDSYADNHLIQTQRRYDDLEILVDVISVDDDTVGVPFRFKDAGDYYLALASRNATPSYPSGGAVDWAGARLYRIESGVANLIMWSPGFAFSYTQGVWTTLRVVARGRRLEFWMDQNGDGLWGPTELLVYGEDTAFDTGRVGVYSYSNGCEFDDFRVYLFDDDDDGVVNEEDNCPLDANPLQEDLDGDEAGDACDDDADGDGVATGPDCDDLDPTIFPGAVERCDGVDEDCDGTPDNAAVDGSPWFLDGDGDGFGAGAPVAACTAPPNHVAISGDCDDLDAFSNPEAPEICDGADNDCDGPTDEQAVDAPTWYADDDGDTFGDVLSPLARCVQPVGFVANAADCDDTRTAVNPSATERCNALDDDCDGLVDEAGAVGEKGWYLDADGDGFGVTASEVIACDPPPSHVGVGMDCDDGSAAAFPGAPEVCDGDDDDCDGLTDEADAVDRSLWYADDDGDGFGDVSAPALACDPPPNHVADATDCDDGAPLVFPGAPEQCNGVDDDCDDTPDDGVVYSDWFPDLDGDGYGDAAASAVSDCVQPADHVPNATDCDDGRADVNPAAIEDCDGVDDNCDGAVDNDAADATPWWPDLDGDGFGVGTPVAACVAPPAHAPLSGDCDDAVDSTFPGAFEQCNLVDDDCDGATDEEVVQASWYVDADGDGYGDPASEVVDCLQPPGTLADGTDCDDTSAAINPGATELPGNGVDEDCDGADADASATDTDDPGTDTEPLTEDTSTRTWAPEDAAEVDGGSASGGCGCASTPGGDAGLAGMPGLLAAWGWLGRRRGGPGRRGGSVSRRSPRPG